VDQATEIYSKEFDGLFARLPLGIRARLIEKIRFLGQRLDSFPHERLQGRTEFRLRVRDYRIIYEFNISRNEIFVITVGHRRDIYR
jgi:mRNA interferase RelE/StbE